MAEKGEEDKEGQEKEAEGQASAKKAGLIKLIIIAVAALAVIGGGGFAAWKLIGGKGEKQTEETAEGGKAAESEKSEKGKGKEAVDPKTLMFPLDPFVVNLGGPGNFLKVTVQMEMSSPSDKTYIEDRLPQVRDSILILLSSKTAASVISPSGKLQLKDDINIRVNKALGKDIVRNIYFTEFVMQ